MTIQVALQCKNAGQARTFLAEATGPIRRWGSERRWVEVVDVVPGEWLEVFHTDNGGGRRCYQVQVGEEVTVWHVIDAADCNLCDDDVLPSPLQAERLGDIDVDVYIAEIELVDSRIASRVMEAGGMIVIPDTHGYATIRKEGVKVTWRDNGEALFDADNVEEALEIAERWL